MYSNHSKEASFVHKPFKIKLSVLSAGAANLQIKHIIFIV